MPKVGEGWVEITTRVDQTSLRNAQRQIELSFDDIEVTVGVDIDRSELAEAASLLHSAFEGVVANIETSIDRTSLARTVREMDALLDAAAINASVGADLNQASLARARAAMAAAFGNVRTNVRVDVDRSWIDRFFRDADSPGGTFFRGGAQAGQGFIRGFLSQIANAFELSGPIGGAIIIGIAALAAALLPPLGAMIGGLITAVLGGLTGISTAIVASIESPEVEEAFDRLKQRLREVFIDNENLDFLSTAWAELIDIFRVAILGEPPIKASMGESVNPWPPGTKAHAEWQPWFLEWEIPGTPGLVPHFESILKAGLPMLEMMVLGIINVLQILVPAFDKFINSRFAMDAMFIFVQGLVRVADEFRKGWERIENDPEAQQGMLIGLQDFFSVLATLVDWSFDAIAALARKWNEIRTDRDASGRTDFEKIVQLIHTWGAIFSAVGAFIGLLWGIFRVLVWDNPAYWEFVEQVQAFFDGLATIIRTVMKFVNEITDLFESDERGGKPGGYSIPKIGDFFGAMGALQGGWSGLAGWFAANVWNQLPQGARTAFEEIARIAVAVAAGIRTGDWSQLATWFHTNVWMRLPGPIQQILSTIGSGFAAAATALRTGDWSGIANWFHTNVWNRIPTPVQSVLQGIIGGFNSAAAAIRSGGFAGLASWFASSVTAPISSIWSSLWGTVVSVVNSAAYSVRAAVASLLNQAIGRINAFISTYNAIPILPDIGYIGYIGYAEGGWVEGPNVNKDVVPAMLTPGEFVVNAEAAARYGPLLEAMNEGKDINTVPIINVYIDGVQTAHRAVVENSQRRIIRELQAGARI